MKCPVCKKPATKEYRPFCSARCKDADLGNWVMEKYRVPDAGSVDPESLPAMEDDEETRH